MINLTVEDIRRIFNYDAMTGELTWRYREECPSKWNTRYSGKIAGSVNHYGYIRIAINNISYRAHRLIWAWVYGIFPEGEIDHINGNPGDNRLVNLRIATHQENLRNVRKSPNNISGVKGVQYDKHRGTWAPQIRVKDKTINLGRFYSLEEAKKIRREAELKYFGEFSPSYQTEPVQEERSYAKIGSYNKSNGVTLR